jgi:hypothetical protein
MYGKGVKKKGVADGGRLGVSVMVAVGAGVSLGIT